MLDTSNLVHSPELLSKETEVYRRQRILFVLINIICTFHMIFLIAFVHIYKTNLYAAQNVNVYYPSVWIITSLIYDIVGLIVAFLCSQIGLRLFVWIGASLFTINLILSGYLVHLLSVLMRSNGSNKNLLNTSRVVLILIFWISILILILISLQAAYKLSKLISTIQHDVIEPMIFNTA